MPKNTKGGNKHKKGKKQNTYTRKLEVAEDGQYYAIVDKIVGNSMALVKYEEPGKGIITINAYMRKSLKKKRQYVNPNKCILISLREFEVGKCDIIHVYSEVEFNLLKKKGLIDNSLEGGSKFDKEDMEFVDLMEEEDKPKIEKPKGLGRNNVVKENYGIESSDEEEEYE